MGGIRYFRSKQRGNKFMSSMQFAAVGDSLAYNHRTGEQSHPFAVMGVVQNHRQYVPNFGEDETHRQHELAKELGVHPEYVSHLSRQNKHRFDEAVSDRIYDANYADTDVERQGHINWLKKQPALNPQTLFTEIEPTTQVSSLFSHSTMTTPAMTLGALAMNATGVSHLIADDDLSPHSSRLAEHARRLGVVTAHDDNKDLDVTNDMNFYDPDHLVDRDSVNRDSAWINGYEMYPIPEHEVAQARQTMRKVLRGNRPAPAPKQHMGEQFEHPKLPGLEDF